MATSRQTTLDGDSLVPVELPDGSVADVSKAAVLSGVAEQMVAHAHSMPYGGIDWPQREGFPIRAEIKRQTEAATRDALEETGWLPTEPREQHL